VESLSVKTGVSFNGITGSSSTTPVADGTAAVGTATTAARADHVHPAADLSAAVNAATASMMALVYAGL
jgi:hypothetical protein